ncbi:MAG: hexose kinase [Rhizobiales bacterium]|nr:hexose kinase [Hyphomicrobiales bacterium]
MSEIVTVTMNPAIDVATSVDHVEATRKLRCKSVRRDAGGGGINVARVVRRLGRDVTAIYPAGGSMGRLLLRLVEEQQIDSAAIDVAEETRENFTAFDESTGDQYRFVLPGPRLREHEWRRCLDALASLAHRLRFVVASGSLPLGVPDDFYAQVARCVAARHAKTLLDTSGIALRKALTEGVFLIKPNLGELRALTQAPLDTEHARVDACRRIIAAGGAEVVALSLGHEGALLMTRDGAWRAPALPVKTVSAVGAGDSFLGAMVWTLSNGEGLVDAFRCGVAAGSAALLTPGTELAYPEDIRRLVAEVSVTPI